MRPVGLHESDAVLGAMRQVALAGGRPLSHAASVVAAGHYLLRHEAFDVGDLPGIEPPDLLTAPKDDPALGPEAVKYLAIMAAAR